MYNYCSSDQKFERLDGLLLDTMGPFLFFEIFDGIYYGATDNTVLDFWWNLPMGFKARVHSPACVLHYLSPTESSESLLVPQLLISWRPAWQPICCHPHTFKLQRYMMTWYKARHAHKRLCTVLPKYRQNPSSPWYHQLQIDERQ